MSLARAFTYAGAESVVMSHWRVNDKSSSDIMEYFYKYLSKGKNKDEALRLAKLEYLASAPPNAQHPFHWNNFVVYGDISPLVSATKWYESWWFYIIICLILSVFMLLTYRKKSQFSKI